MSKIEEFDAQKAFENEDHLVELRVHIQVHVGLVFPIKMTTRPWSNDYFSWPHYIIQIHLHTTASLISFPHLYELLFTYLEIVQGEGLCSRV